MDRFDLVDLFLAAGYLFGFTDLLYPFILILFIYRDLVTVFHCAVYRGNGRSAFLLRVDRSLFIDGNDLLIAGTVRCLKRIEQGHLLGISGKKEDLLLRKAWSPGSSDRNPVICALGIQG